MSKDLLEAEVYIEEDPRRSWYWLPNWVSYFRILLSPAPGIMLLVVPADNFPWQLTALIVFVCLGFSDSLDGALARGLDQRSKLGMVMDPIGDKLLVFFTTIAVMVHYAATSAGPLLAITLWAICAREFILTAQIRIAQHGEVVSPTILGKVKTVVQLIALGCWFLPFSQSLVVAIGWVVTPLALLITLWSWWEYYHKYVAAMRPSIRRRHPW